MAGFGKKNARLTQLRAGMLHAAAQGYLREVEYQRLLTDDDIRQLLTSVFSGTVDNVTPREFDYAVSGTKALMRERSYVEELATRWTRGAIGIGYDDMKRLDRILAVQTR
jgi:hypothetical protein